MRWPIPVCGRALALPAEDKRAEAVADQAHRRWLVATDSEEHVEQLGPYLDLGFRHLVFHAPGEGQAGFLELHGREVLPRLRARWS